MRNRTFRCLILTAMLGGYAALFGAPAVAAEPVVLKISHQFPANTDFRDQVARKFAAEVEKRTNGAIKFQIRSEEHTSELQSLMRISYAVFCLKKKNTTTNTQCTSLS